MNHRRFMTSQREGGVSDSHRHRVAARERFGNDTNGFTRCKSQFEKAGSQCLLFNVIGRNQSGHGRALAFFQQRQMRNFSLHDVISKSDWGFAHRSRFGTRCDSMFPTEVYHVNDNCS
jgi:hypothetical protein